MIVYAGEDAEKGEHSSITGGNANLDSHFRNQHGGFSENWESTYFKTQKFHSWAHTQRMLNHTTKTFTQLCSYQHYLKQPEPGNNLDAPQLKNG